MLLAIDLFYMGLYTKTHMHSCRALTLQLARFSCLFAVLLPVLVIGPG